MQEWAEDPRIPGGAEDSNLGQDRKGVQRDKQGPGRAVGVTRGQDMTGSWRLPGVISERGSQPQGSKDGQWSGEMKTGSTVNLWDRGTGSTVNPCDGTGSTANPCDMEMGSTANPCDMETGSKANLCDMETGSTVNPCDMEMRTFKPYNKEIGSTVNPCVMETGSMTNPCERRSCEGMAKRWQKRMWGRNERWREQMLPRRQ